ncbi:hypothetical protein [Urbifossiella limnaea]|uniref:Uncharacterized protein n=1 Tax=Urbifossiella limnaea TaxID=2528023 RepID=A0A517XNH6_9BACT|nr:hypothetical protein [Urbifossiella limnaea]QDU19052.1 hypothetical protein ETAA1_09550 [Urbifossiella limnaea]
MGDPHTFAADVFRAVCAGLADKAADLHLLVAADAPFGGWLEGEAFLACRRRQAEHGWCEVAARPTYGSEGVAGADGRPSAACGGLRVGGSGEPGDHCWLFAEVVLLLDGDGRVEEWRARTEAAAARLLQLGWKRSASVLVVVAAGRGDVPTDWADDLARLAAWNRPGLADPVVLVLPGGGSVAVRAVDVKRDPAHTLTAVGGPG